MTWCDEWLRCHFFRYAACFSSGHLVVQHTHSPSHSAYFFSHMVPFYFHIDSGSKSALWGVKHWHWRAALATKTDGNPPANPSSSRPIITSQWPKALLSKPLLLPPTSFLCSFGEKDDASLNLITISKISHKIIPRGLASGWWQRAQRSLIPNVSRSYDTGRQSDVLLPSSQTGASFSDLTSKLQQAVKQPSRPDYSAIKTNKETNTDSQRGKALMICSFHDSILL